jgi:hypothetical protein
VIVQDGDEILLLWYKDDVFAIENRSPAEGAYSEGLLNAKLTQVTVRQNDYLSTCSILTLYQSKVDHTVQLFEMIGESI